MKHKTIFILVPSYGDSECRNTIKDIYRKARYLERIFIGFVGSMIEKMGLIVFMKVKFFKSILALRELNVLRLGERVGISSGSGVEYPP